MELVKTKSTVLQLMRGIAIVIVIFRHAIAQVNAGYILSNLEQIIICFHMPVFFMISGYLYQEKVDKYLAKGKVKFIVGKVRHLLVPYVFWTVLLWGGVQVACNIEKVKEIVATIGFEPMSFGRLLIGLLTYENYYTEHLWFVYVLFVFFVINIFMGRHGDGYVFFAFAVGMGIINNYLSLPYIVGKCFTWCAFFVGGRVLASNKRLMESIQKVKDNKTFVLVCSAFFICSILRLLAVNFEINVLARFLIKEMVGFLGVLLVYGVAIRIAYGSKKLCKYIYTVGEYSYDIYLIHNPYVVATCAILLNRILGVPAFISVMVTAVVGVVIPVMMSNLIIRKIKPLSMVMIGK